MLLPMSLVPRSSCTHVDPANKPPAAVRNARLGLLMFTLPEDATSVLSRAMPEFSSAYIYPHLSSPPLSTPSSVLYPHHSHALSLSPPCWRNPGHSLQTRYSSTLTSTQRVASPPTSPRNTLSSTAKTVRNACSSRRTPLSQLVHRTPRRSPDTAMGAHP